jgi:hypothetical protein
MCTEQITPTSAWFVRTIGTLLLGSLTLASAPVGAGEQAPPFGFVVLGERDYAMRGEVVPLVRMVIDQDGKDGKDGKDPCKGMVLTGPEGRSPLTGWIRRDAPSGSWLSSPRYPVTVCETVMPFADRYRPEGESWQIRMASPMAPVHTVHLPTVMRHPEQVVIFGDSGCRGQAKVQPCDNKSWPFATTLPNDIARQIRAHGRPSLLLHVGDLRYRGDEDHWDLWRKDFFDPMRTSGLLAMAPLVITRGNHELCEKYGHNGPGWFYLLDPVSPLLTSRKDILKHNSCLSGADHMLTPYRLDLYRNFSLLLADSAALPEGSVDRKYRDALVETFRTMGASMSSSSHMAWLVTHKPIWSVMGKNKGNEPGKTSNRTAQEAVAALPGGRMPEPVRLILSGHKHLFSAVEFMPGQHPLSLTVGNGGVHLNCKAHNGRVTPKDWDSASGAAAMVHSMNAFGYVTAQLQVEQEQVTGWTLEIWGYDNALTSPPMRVASCRHPVTGTAACQLTNSGMFPYPGCQGDDED